MVEDDTDVPTSLDEESTEPLSDPKGLVSRHRLEHELRQYLALNGARLMTRGMPFIDRVVYDRGRQLPRVWVGLQVPFSGASEATLELLRRELGDFADRLEQLFEGGFVVSLIVE